MTRAKRSKPISSLDNSSSDQLHILPGGGIQIQHGIRKVAGELQRTQPHVYSTKSAVIVFTGYLSNLSELLDRCQLQDSIPEPRSPIFRNTSTSELTSFDLPTGIWQLLNRIASKSSCHAHCMQCCCARNICNAEVSQSIHKRK